MRHAAVAARPQRDPHRSIDGQRQDEAVVVVGVLADQIDPARRANHPLRLAAETPHEMLYDLRFTKRRVRDLLRND